MAAIQELIESQLIDQHLIDPEICIRCNTCEATCTIGAITHDDRNYVVDPSICNQCLDCISPCPTGAIDNWRRMPRSRAYSVEEQLGWDELPAQVALDEIAPADEAALSPGPRATPVPAAEPGEQRIVASQYGASLPPWSAAHAYTNLYPPNAPTEATVVGNVRITEAGRESETHHIVLDLGTMPFPVLEGQSIGVLAPGLDAQGKPHFARQYSVASPRNGERPGYNNLSLTVKRVTVDHQGAPVRAVCSNYLCDLAVGDRVRVIGPFGASFLMPNHPKSNIVMICTGTGSAPMRAMTEWRRRLRASGKFQGGRLVLFFGARTREELPYFGPLMNLPRDFIDINLAFSRAAGQPRRYVQDLMRERAADLAPLLADPDTCIYVCGLKSMEEGVVLALRDIAREAGLDFEALAAELRERGRLHLETY
ncbi:MAG: benzoyl-CoA 2,3-epoxidase subunit BoxA [Burkholderiaceae bacterium]